MRCAVGPGSAQQIDAWALPKGHEGQCNDACAPKTLRLTTLLVEVFYFIVEYTHGKHVCPIRYKSDVQCAVSKDLYAYIRSGSSQRALCTESLYAVRNRQFPPLRSFVVSSVHHRCRHHHPKYCNTAGHSTTEALRLTEQGLCMHSMSK